MSDKYILEEGFRVQAAAYTAAARFDVLLGIERTPKQREMAFADIPGLFQIFAGMPSADSFDPFIRDLERAIATLSSGQQARDPIDGTKYQANVILTKLPGSESSIEDWSGRAAMEFKTKFIDPFPAIVSNQFLLAVVLKSALEATKEMWAKTRDDILQIASKAITALENLGQCDKNRMTVVFTVLAAVLATVAVPIGAVAEAPLIALATEMTAVGGEAQVIPTLLPDNPPTNEFSAETPDAIIENMRSAIRMLIQDVGKVEEQIAKALHDDLRLVTTHRDVFVSPRPSLAGATPADITSPQFMGYAT